MKDRDIADLMEKARASLDAAKELLQARYPDFAASRCYYAMFHAVEAILLTKDLSFSKHKAVISAFGREFVKADVLPAALHRAISEAFDARQAADYGPMGSVGKEKATALIQSASDFIQACEGHLKSEGIDI